jgi:site-specific DNA recombinase
MERAAVYTRISKDTEARALGVARQEAECRQLVEQLGWDVAEVHSDNDISAFSGRRRPGYEAMLESLKAGRITAVVAWHQDRLQRSPRELEGFIDAVEAAGAKVATVRAGNLDLSTASGRMTARVVGAVARHESEQKSERQLSKARELALAGKVGGGGVRPYGYNDDRITVRAEEAEVVRRIVAELLAGATMRGVTMRLNRDGIATVTGTLWRIHVVRNLVTSPRIAGLREHRGEIVGQAEWPAIVDRADWESLRRRRDDAAALRQTRPARRYLLTGGIARCGLCGAKLVARPNGDGRRSIVCAGRDSDFDGCGKIRSLAEPLEAWVAAQIFRYMADSDLADEIAAVDAAPTGDVDELAGVEERLDQLAVDWADGVVDRRSWMTARSRLEARAAALRSAMATTSRARALAGIPADGTLEAIWPDLDIDQRRAIVTALIDRVDVGPAVAGRNYFDPGRVSIAWR